MARPTPAWLAPWESYDNNPRILWPTAGGCKEESPSSWSCQLLLEPWRVALVILSTFEHPNHLLIHSTARVLCSIKEYFNLDDLAAQQWLWMDSIYIFSSLLGFIRILYHLSINLSLFFLYLCLWILFHRVPIYNLASYFTCSFLTESKSGHHSISILLCLLTLVGYWLK